MKTIISSIAMVMVVFIVSANATIIDIPEDYPTIQQGIDASADGDTVLVQPGTYVENINFNGHNIVLGSMFLTTGDTSYVSATVVDGDSLMSVVKFEGGEDSNAILTGFTIQNGFSEGGGGIYCDNSSPLIIKNRIVGNIGCWGGGIACQSSDPIITDNYIYENMASS